MNRSSRDRVQGQAATTLKKLLGSLELESMEFMWQAREATVQRVTEAINRKRPVAYTTVMTVMGHLVDKGLLTRTKEGKRYRYRVARSKDEFLRDTSRSRLHALLDDFGDLAIIQFLGEINKLTNDEPERLRSLNQDSRTKNNVSE